MVRWCLPDNTRRVFLVAGGGCGWGIFLWLFFVHVFSAAWKIFKNAREWL